MAAVEVGGDSSVKWVVDVGHVRGSELLSQGRGPKGHRQKGVDETDPGGYFKITIELPEDATARADFIASLQTATSSAQQNSGIGGHAIEFSLKIEDNQGGGKANDKQITITWNSKP